MQKLKNIEFLRTFLICGIVMLHCCVSSAWSFSKLFKDINIYKTLHDCFAHSNNGVEGFFIIAGFFLVLTFKDSISLSNFIKKKYIRLSPVIAWATILCIGGWLLNTMHFKVVPNILTVLLLNHFGICWGIGANPVLWFCSALFFGLLVYFCIFKFVPDKFKFWICFFVSILSYIILQILQYGRYADPYHNYYHIFNIGILRALGGIGLGCIIGYFYKEYIQKISKFNVLNWQKILITIFEVLFFGAIFWWMCIPHVKINNFVYVILFVILFILFLINKGYFSNFVNKDIWVFLGKYQYSVYVIHYVIGKILCFGLWKKVPIFMHNHPIIPLVITILCVIVLSVFTYHFVEIPCAEYLKNLIFVKSEKPLYKRIFGGG